MICDQVFYGIHKEDVRMKLLELKDQTFDKVAKICAVHETSAKHLKALRQQGTSDLSQDADPLHTVKATKQKSVTRNPITPLWNSVYFQEKCMSGMGKRVHQLWQMQPLRKTIQDQR